MERRLRTVVSGLAFGEAPRWRHDGLYFSDIHANRIGVIRPDGTHETVATFSGPVSGLGWLPDGRLLVVSMHDKRVLRGEGHGCFVLHADLSAIATGFANDMVVARDGTAYVGNFGMVITQDGATLIVAESRGRCLTAFEIAQDGTLSKRRLWASLPDGAFPDGICMDAESAIWVASPSTRELLRLREGGAVTERVPTGLEAIVCMLGGVDRKTLFVCTAESRDPMVCRVKRTGRIEAMEVEVGGAGLP